MMAMVWVLSQKFVESNNKDILNYLKFLSRKINPVAQMTDVMSRLLERSVKFCRPNLAVGFVRSSFLEFRILVPPPQHRFRLRNPKLPPKKGKYTYKTSYKSFKVAGVGKIEDNLTSADPPSYTTTTSKLKVDPLEKNKRKNETKNERKNETRKEFKMKKVIKE